MCFTTAREGQLQPSTKKEKTTEQDILENKEYNKIYRCKITDNERNIAKLKY
jgi:hypothetical protein